MEIIMTDYPSGSPQDLKYLFFKKVYHNKNVRIFIMYEIDFIAHVIEGLKDSEEGRTITTEELLKRVEEWSK